MVEHACIHTHTVYHLLWNYCMDKSQYLRQENGLKKTIFSLQGLSSYNKGWTEYQTESNTRNINFYSSWEKMKIIYKNTTYSVSNTHTEKDPKTKKFITSPEWVVSDFQVNKWISKYLFSTWLGVCSNGVKPWKYKTHRYLQGRYNVLMETRVTFRKIVEQYKKVQ